MSDSFSRQTVFLFQTRTYHRLTHKQKTFPVIFDGVLPPKKEGKKHVVVVFPFVCERPLSLSLFTTLQTAVTEEQPAYYQSNK